jgi:TetR/AcrR family transcriptional regulator, transcriptional repressor for nem operon
MGRTSDAKERLMEAVKELIWTGSYGTTTIDQICDKAGVKRGSFYYFFESKAELAETAIEEDWQKRRPGLDSMFSPTVPPLERLEKYCEFNYQFQKEICAKYGCVLGCPLFSLGAEVSTQEARLQKKIESILDYKKRYFESAIRDAHASGFIHAPDPKAKAAVLFCYYQGLVTEARIRNDVEILKGAVQGTRELLGVREPAMTEA